MKYNLLLLLLLKSYFIRKKSLNRIKINVFFLELQKKLLVIKFFWNGEYF